MYFLLNMGIFQCHVSFQGCIFSTKKTPPQRAPFVHGLSAPVTEQLSDEIPREIQVPQSRRGGGHDVVKPGDEITRKTRGETGIIISGQFIINP